MSTPVGKTGIAFARLWHLADAKGQVLGRLARGVATTLMGEHKPIYDPSNDCGDYVVVINARHIVVSGNKLDTKKYRSHSGYAGGITEVSLERMMRDNPEQVIRKAVYGMLAKNQLRQKRINRLLIFPDDKHPYAQNIAKFYEHPEMLKVNRRQWAEMSTEDLQKFQSDLVRSELVKHGLLK
ncbi:hypothetical protein MP228_006701 [Amoeboaphelidium protococcarum]|nr:hypothetical protein MP228_006701 [Amoeboaphelidium protococcarum]